MAESKQPFKLQKEKDKWVARNKGRILASDKSKSEASKKAVQFLRTGKPVTDRLKNVVEIQYRERPQNIERFGTWKINARFRITNKKKFVGNFWGSSDTTPKIKNANVLIEQAKVRALLLAVQKEGLIPDYEKEIIPSGFKAELLRFRWVVYRDIKEAQKFEFPRA